MALSSAFEELEVLLKQHVKGSNSSEKKKIKEQNVVSENWRGISINLGDLSAVLAQAVACGHTVQQIVLPKADQALKISCNICEKSFEVRDAVEESLNVKSDAIEMKSIVLFTGYQSDRHASILTKLGAEVTSSLDSATLVVTDSLRLTSSLVGAVCKGLPILSPAWVLASKAAEALLPIGKFLLRDQYREQHWGVDLAATVAKARRGVGVLEGKQVVFRLDSNFGGQEGEEGTLGDYKALVKMAGGAVVNEGTNGNGKVTLMVVEGGKDMEEVELLRMKEAKVVDKVVDKKTFLRGLLRQSF